MRILFHCLGDYGHFHPLSALAVASRRCGHEVRFATDEHFVDKVRSHGFEAVGIPGRVPVAGSAEYVEWAGSIAGLSLAERAPAVMRWFWEGGLRGARPLAAEAERWGAGLILREQTAWGGAIAARLTGRDCATFYFRPYRPTFLREVLDTGPDEDLAELGIRGGLGEIETETDLPLVGWPRDWMRDGEAVSTARFIRPPMLEANSGSKPEWLLGLGVDRPLVYATLGTVFTGDRQAFRAIVDGLVGLDVDALLTVGPKRSGRVDTALFDGLPDRIRVEEYVEQAHVLPRASVVISHGGYGTSTAALLHGIPLVFIPQEALDNRINARRIERTRAGLIVEEKRAEAVGKAVHSVISDPSIRVAAARARDTLESLPDENEIVKVLGTS